MGLWQGIGIDCLALLWTLWQRLRQRQLYVRGQMSGGGGKCPLATVEAAVRQHTAGTGSAPTEFTEQRCAVIRPSRGENQPSDGVDDELKPVDEVTGNAGRHRIAVVNLADRWSTN